MSKVCVCSDYFVVDDAGELCLKPGSMGLRQMLVYDNVGTFQFKKADYPWLARIRVQVQGAGGGSAGADAAAGQYIVRDTTHWDEVVVRLAYEHLRRHDLRHTGLTWMADAGVPLHVLRKIAGHGSLTTTQRYLHPDRRSIDLAGAALSAHLTGARVDPATGPKTESGPKVVPQDRPKRHLRVVR